MIGNTNAKYGIKVSDKDGSTVIYSPDKTSKIEMTDNLVFQDTVAERAIFEISKNGDLYLRNKDKEGNDVGCIYDGGMYFYHNYDDLIWGGVSQAEYFYVDGRSGVLNLRASDFDGGADVLNVDNGSIRLCYNYKESDNMFGQSEVLLIYPNGHVDLYNGETGLSMLTINPDGLTLHDNYEDDYFSVKPTSLILHGFDGYNVLEISDAGFKYCGKEIDTDAKAMYRHAVRFEFEYNGNTIGTSFDVISSRSTRYTDITQIPIGNYHVYDYVTYGIENSEKCFLRSVRIAPDPRNGIIKACANYECYDSSGCLVEYSSESITLDTESSNYTITTL